MKNPNQNQISSIQSHIEALGSIDGLTVKDTLRTSAEALERCRPAYTLSLDQTGLTPVIIEYNYINGNAYVDFQLAGQMDLASWLYLRQRLLDYGGEILEDSCEIWTEKTPPGNMTGNKINTRGN